MKTLILTEKPSVAMDFARALAVKGKKDGYLEDARYIITWAIGHLVELLEPHDYDSKWKRWRLEALPIMPDKFLYKPIKERKKQLSIIRTLLAKRSFENLVIATDAGREGEVIARSILSVIGFKGNGRLKRFWTSQALTPEVVRGAMKSLKPASEYDRLWRAGQLRQIADWLVGMNLTRAATVKMNDLFSVGRVQTAVLSLLVDRRREREDFKPEPYWTLNALFSNPKGAWWGIWFKGDQTRFKSAKQGNDVISKIAHQVGTVLSVKKQKKQQPPPPLYSLTDLQREANAQYAFSAQKTLNLAQALYDRVKCLSYPRTDSRVLGSQNVRMAQSLVKNLSQPYPDIFARIDSNLISASNKRVFNDAKLTDHHAIIPLAPVPSDAKDDAKKIYELVLRRFAAAFHPDLEYEQTEIITEVQKETFRTRGRKVLKLGWQAVYGPQKETQGDQLQQQDLPPVAKGDSAKVEKTNLEKKQTIPPPEYTEALLLQDMVNPGKYVSEDELKKIYKGDVGLGTQATRAQTIETLLGRAYVERKRKSLVATDKGCHLIDTVRQFKVARKLASAEETARWERMLQQISFGEGSAQTFIAGIKDFVTAMVQEFKESEVKAYETQDLGQCPACRGEIIEGKKGYGCSNWKKGCRFVIWKRIAGKRINASTAPPPKSFFPRKRHLFSRAFNPRAGKSFQPDSSWPA
jgi:DNA topoisomerase-3